MAKQVVVQADSIAVPSDGLWSLLVSTAFQVGTKQDVSVWLRINDARIVGQSAPSAEFQLSIDALDRTLDAPTLKNVFNGAQGLSLKASLISLDPGTYIASGHAKLGTSSSGPAMLEVARAYLVVAGSV